MRFPLRCFCVRFVYSHIMSSIIQWIVGQFGEQGYHLYNESMLPHESCSLLDHRWREVVPHSRLDENLLHAIPSNIHLLNNLFRGRPWYNFVILSRKDEDLLAQEWVGLVRRGVGCRRGVSTLDELQQ